MCPIYSGFGSPSFCYEFDETAGTTLLDASGAGHNGTISASGVTYRAPGLASNSSAAETTDGVTGSMSAGISPAAGSFSASFFVNLRANANNFPRLAVTGDPKNTTPASGWYVTVNSGTTNQIYADMGYGSGSATFGFIPLAFNTPANVTMTYNATGNVATLCVGTSSSPVCKSTTLPAAYVPSGKPLVFGGGSIYNTHPANATFDEAAYWQGTVLTTGQIATIAGFAGTGPAPTPTPTPSPVPTPTSSASSQGTCPIYGGFGSAAFCYDFDEASGTTLLDASGAGHNGTISASGVTYRAPGLTSNSSASEITDGVTGSMTAGISPAAGSFSVSFFVDLHANANNWPRLAVTGDPKNTSPASGWYITVNSGTTNKVYAQMGYGSGNLGFGFIPLALNTPVNVTLTYNASGNVATLCVGTTAPPTCASTTLPAAYVPSGKPIVFGGGSIYNTHPANASFDEAAYWQGTVLTSTQIATVAAYAGIGASPPPSPQPTPAFNDWSTYGFDNARDGFNPNSSAITPASLGKLHLAWELQLPNDDFNTQTQPILATNIGSHAGILIVGGALGTVYGYDALTGGSVWATPVGTSTVQCSGAPYSLGVGGSAVYDAAAASVYVTSNSNTVANGPTQLFFNKLNVANGALQTRVNVAPSPLPGELNFTHTSLTLANGVLYAGTASTCDISSWRGSIVAVSESAMTLSNTFYTVWNQGQAPSPAATPFSGGGVWGWGGVSIDPSGNVWTAVGNLDTNSGLSGPQPPFVQDSTEFDAFGEHVLQLTPNLASVIQNDYPGFTFGGASNDLDISGSPVLAQPVGCDLAAAVQGKSGYLYLYDTTAITNGPGFGYKFTSSSSEDPNLGNPAFSPLTGLYYAAVASGVTGGVTPAPGMVAVRICNSASSIAWSTQFGPDSMLAKAPRSMPTVTAGGVVFVGTPCLRDLSGGCTGTTGTYGGALWALDASSGALLNGGNPIVTTSSTIRMGAVVDGDWVYLFDNGGNLFGLTIDPSYQTIPNRLLRAPRLHGATLWR